MIAAPALSAGAAAASGGPQGASRHAASRLTKSGQRRKHSRLPPPAGSKHIRSPVRSLPSIMGV